MILGYADNEQVCDGDGDVVVLCVSSTVFYGLFFNRIKEKKIEMTCILSLTSSVSCACSLLSRLDHK